MMKTEQLQLTTNEVGKLVNQSFKNEIVEIQNPTCADLDSLIGINNRPIKQFFINSLNNGYSHELMGHLFEKSLEKFDRKDKGQFYTPKSIVEYMISQLDVKNDSRILDPSCGCGSFLLTVFDIFRKKYGVQTIRNIFGVDINEDAINMTRLCLYSKTDFKSNYVSLIKQNIKTGNSIVANKLFDKNAFVWDAEFKDVLDSGGFDFIIGNPPYVTLSGFVRFDATESIYQKIIDGHVNAATLMIGRSLELLKENGVLTFLLPKSILYVDAYAKLRKYLAHNTEIFQIYDLGSKFKDVRGEQFILFIRKKLPTKDSKVKICVFNAKAKCLSEQFCTTVQQNKFISTGKFHTFDFSEHYDLISKLSGIGIKLNEFVDGKIFRGLPIGGNRVEVNNNRFQEKVIRGRDITKFKLKLLPVVDGKLIEAQSQNKISIIRQKKIVLQNIFSSESGVIAAYDPNKLLSLDTVTNIIVRNDDEGKYLLALMNSKLINFYITHSLFNKSRLTMHLDKSYIGSIPIITDPDKRSFNCLKEIIDTLNKTDDFKLRKQKNKEIDQIVYALYSFNNQEIKLVEEAMDKMLSQKSVW